MIFSYSAWRSLPLQTRVLIAQQFGIAKVGTTHVVDNTIQSDGYNVEDVERALNDEAILAYVGVKDATPEVWDVLVGKITSPVVVSESVTVSTPVVTEVIVTETKPKKVTKAKKSK